MACSPGGPMTTSRHLWFIPIACIPYRLRHLVQQPIFCSLITQLPPPLTGALFQGHGPSPRKLHLKITFIIYTIHNYSIFPLLYSLQCLPCGVSVRKSGTVYTPLLSVSPWSLYISITINQTHHQTSWRHLCRLTTQPTWPRCCCCRDELAYISLVLMLSMPSVCGCGAIVSTLVLFVPSCAMQYSPWYSQTVKPRLRVELCID